MFLSAVWTLILTAEDPLLNKLCNAKFLQICPNEETNSLMAQIHFQQSFIFLAELFFLIFDKMTGIFWCCAKRQVEFGVSFVHVVSKLFVILCISCFACILIFIIDNRFGHTCGFQEHENRPAAADYIPGKDFNHDKLHEGIFLQSKWVYCSCVCEWVSVKRMSMCQW